jgi:Protein of unknown function (DUF3300)
MNMHIWMTWLRRSVMLALLAAAPGWAVAQAVPAEAAAVVYDQEELDQLMAPVALYPDTLLMQVLVAATYPLEIVEAGRFIAANPKLKGESLTKAAANKGWDLSVVSLLQFPSVITMMNDKLEWTQQLGDAFLAQQPEVMDTVQALRARAQQAGNLQSTTQQKVVVQEKIIVIEPAQPQVVYVPYYNPTVIYGPWWAPARPPWYWVPPPIYRPPSFGQVVATGIFWGVAIGIRNEIWNDYRPSWRDRQINVHNHVTIVNVNNRPRPGGQWRHDPVHRKGVAYRDNNVRDRVTAGTAVRPSGRPSARPGAIERLPSRGDDDNLKPRPAVRPPSRPDAKPAKPRPGSDAVARPSPISPGASRDVVKAQAERGRASRETAAKPATRPAPDSKPAKPARPAAAAKPARIPKAAQGAKTGAARPGALPAAR